jgi:putative nucleotidyltransferase with HDIG domain
MPQAADPPSTTRSGPSSWRWRTLFERAGAGTVLAVVLAVVTLVALPPGEGLRTPVYEVGSVADETVIAPFAFRVPRPAAELAGERERAAARVAPVFRFVPHALDSVRARLARFAGVLDTTTVADPRDEERLADSVRARTARLGLSFTPVEAAWLAFPSRRDALIAAVRRTFERTLPEGVAASRALDGQPSMLQIARDEAERTVPSDAVQSWSDVLRVARGLHPQPSSPIADGAYQELLSGVFEPSLQFDSATTSARRAEAVAGVLPWRFEVRSGEKIIDAHEIVREEDRARLETLRAIATGGAVGGIGSWRMLGAFLVNLAVMAIFVLTLAFYRPEIYARPRALFVIGLSLGVVMLGAAFAVRQAAVPGVVIPIGAAALLISILFDSRIALVSALVFSVLLGVQPALRGGVTLFLVLAGGVAAAFSVRALERRTQFMSSIATIAGAYGTAVLVVGVAYGWGSAEMLEAALYGALNGVVSVALAMALHPAAEEVCGVDTYLKLLEWSDLNRPLLRRLALEAPGTWAHTLAMANLVESATRAVGGNALLARVGTYYHDIGKLARPEFFVENQGGDRNPHDALKPAASATIIRDHVREGLALAAAHKVPRSVQAFIAEHHGTSAISYFLEKARARDARAAQLEAFRYPGPRPQSLETAVCMLADGVEAAARVLPDPSPERVREVVETIVRGRLESGQLRDAPITLQQIELVKDAFVRVLTASRHRRIDYPGPDGVSRDLAARRDGPSSAARS